MKLRLGDMRSGRRLQTRVEILEFHNVDPDRGFPPLIRGVNFCLDNLLDISNKSQGFTFRNFIHASED